MKVLILAGGLGTRISEETVLKPKPMILIGDKPILWHIMKIYDTYGFNEFIILAGYKSHIIKEFFMNYYIYNSDITFDLQNQTYHIHKTHAENWKVTVLDSGIESSTGGRILYAKDYIGNEPFLLTYGDAVSDINIPKLIETHKKSKKYVTVTAVQPEGRFGSINIEKNNSISSFLEKPKGDSGWINGGFFVCQPEVLNYIENHLTTFEYYPLSTLAKEGQLQAYKHEGFWKCMDTLRDKMVLEEMWEAKKAKWKIWE